MSKTITPIWKDTFWDFGSGDYADYEVYTDGGVLVYEGRAYKRPDADSILVKANEICADHLGQVLPIADDKGYFAQPIVDGFYAIANGTQTETIYFAYDWSYEERSSNVASSPIVPTLDRNQLLIYSIYQGSNISAIITLDDDTTITQTISIFTLPSFSSAFSNDYAKTLSTDGGAGSAVFIPSQYPDAVSITIGGITYPITDNCSRYALYYVNAFGGWDSLLMTDGYTESDDYTRYEHSQEFDNSVSYERGVVNFQNDITKKWVLNTPLLTDAQSLKMHHIFGSTAVYLFDIVEGRYYPVTITDKSLTYKTYKVSGRKIPQYSINVQLARPRVRR